ncbi:MAG: pdt [Rhodospirillales bacterium]|nr:pdt [Rhodospirillales bacterium]
MSFAARHVKAPISVALIALGAVNTLQVASAQQADAASSGQIEEIVVTATQRSEKLKNVPASISVLGGRDLEERHIVDYDDIARSVPGVSFVAHGGTGEEDIEIRGIGSTNGSSTVGVYIDNIPIITTIGHNGIIQPKFLDLNRVEVLRGPQGTLFGASSEGGTIRLITNQPDLENYFGSLKADLSGTDHGGVNYDGQAIVNVPVVPGKFALRGAFEYGDDSGWVDHYNSAGVLDKPGVNDERNEVARITGKFQPSDDLTVTPAVFFQRIKDADSPAFVSSLGLYKTNQALAEPVRDTMFIPSLTINKDLGFAMLTSVTSYYWRQNSRQSDGTFFNSGAVAQDVLDPVFPQHKQENDTILANIVSPVYATQTYNTETQEVRLASPSKEDSGLPFSWVVGLYYQDQASTHRDYEPAPGFSAAFEKIYGVNINQSYLGSPDDPHLWDGDLMWQTSERNDARQYAAFGQVDFDVTAKFHGSAGLRYTYARESFTQLGYGYFDAGNAGTLGIPYSQNAHFYAATPKFSATYDISEDTTAYATAAKGFRLGGATTPNENTLCLQGFKVLGINDPPRTYGPDKLWSYEAGAKSSLLNKTLSVSGDAYYIQWTQIQQSISIPICGGSLNTNVGDAEAYGGEMEVRYKPTEIPGLTIGANGGVEHAVITSTINAKTAAVGQKVLFTPDWSASISADYTWPLTAEILAFVRGDYNWIGRAHGSFRQSDPNFSNPQYGVINASVGVDVDALQVALYAKNLTNDQTIIQKPHDNGIIKGYTVRPLTVGMTVSKQF